MDPVGELVIEGPAEEMAMEEIPAAEMTPAELLLASRVQGYGRPPVQSDDTDDEEVNFIAMLSPTTKVGEQLYYNSIYGPTHAP